MSRKITPVTSSHSWCMAWVNDRPVVRAALISALKVRWRGACAPAAGATTPAFRQVESLLTLSILTACGATMTPHVREQRTVPGLMASNKLVGQFVRGAEWIHN